MRDNSLHGEDVLFFEPDAAAQCWRWEANPGGRSLGMDFAPG